MKASALLFSKDIQGLGQSLQSWKHHLAFHQVQTHKCENEDSLRFCFIPLIPFMEQFTMKAGNSIAKLSEHVWTLNTKFQHLVLPDHRQTMAARVTKIPTLLSLRPSYKAGPNSSCLLISAVATQQKKGSKHSLIGKNCKRFTKKLLWAVLFPHTTTFLSPALATIRLHSSGFLD